MQYYRRSTAVTRAITVGVLRAPARSGAGIFNGTASNFLSRQHVGGTVADFIKPPGIPFHVPDDPSTPMVLIATGTAARVQDKVREHGQRVLDLMGEGGNVYVCGGAETVAPALRSTFAKMYQQRADCSTDEATAWLEEQRTSNRYLEDVWAAH